MSINCYDISRLRKVDTSDLLIFSHHVSSLARGGNKWTLQLWPGDDTERVRASLRAQRDDMRTHYCQSSNPALVL